jgi:hypothetical protein
MTIPSRVKIGPGYWAVAYAPLNEAYGLCDEERRTILIRQGMDPMMTQVTLWHEMIHAMLYTLGFPKHNERVVDGLAYQMVALLKDNKELWK